MLSGGIVAVLCIVWYYSSMRDSTFTTIPRAVTGREELVVLPRRILERLLSNRVREEEILRWSHEAKKLKKAGKLSLLRSLGDL